MSLTVWRSSFVVMAALALSACGMSSDQRAAVAAFASSADTFGTAANDALPEIRDSVIELRSVTRSMPGDGGRFQYDEYRKKGGFKYLMDQGFTKPDVIFSLDSLAARAKLASLLVAYGKGLSDMMAVGSADAMKPIFTSISTSLGGLPGMSDEAKKSLQGVGGAAGPLAALAVDAERLAYLRRIVPKFHPAIRDAAKLIAADFTPGNENVLGKYETAVNSTGSAVREASEVAKTSAERAEVVRSTDKVDRHWNRANVLGKQIPQAAAAMEKAHQALVDALEDRAFSFDDISQFAKEAALFYALIRAAM